MATEGAEVLEGAVVEVEELHVAVEEEAGEAGGVENLVSGGVRKW